MAEKKKKDMDLLKVYQRILELVKLQWPRLLVAMFCMMLVAFLTAGTAYLVKPVLDEIFFKKDMRMLKLLPFAIIILYVVKGACYFGQNYLMNYVGHSIIMRLRDKLYVHIQMLPLAFFHKNETGLLMARMATTSQIQMLKMSLRPSMMLCTNIIPINIRSCTNRLIMLHHPSNGRQVQNKTLRIRIDLNLYLFGLQFILIKLSDLVVDHCDEDGHKGTDDIEEAIGQIGVG